MIYYFSATGNSKWAAMRLADLTGDEARSIADITRGHEPQASIGADDVLGIVYPIYMSDTPKYVTDFLRTLQIDERAYVYVVCTCNVEAGYAVSRVRKVVHVDAAWSLSLPDNYVALLPVEPQDSCERKFAEAPTRLERIARAVNAREPVAESDEVERGGIPHLKTFVLSPIFQRVVCRDRKFHATGVCTSCGKCARVCPLENISLAGGRPTWHDNCMHCMACIQNCPTRAIQYGKSTESKGRYVFPDPRYRV